MNRNFKDWFTFILQSLAWIAGIAVAIKQLLPKTSSSLNKGVFEAPKISPDIWILVLTAIGVLIITGILKYWGDR